MARRRVIKPGEERRADLLDAALAVFAERGVDEATVSDITTRADVAKGTFYLYFPSKDHLVAALWERYVNGFLDLAGKALADPTAAGALTALLERLIDHAVAHADLHRIVYGSADARALALCREIDQRVVEVIAEAIRRGVDAGALRPCDPAAFANVVYHGAPGTLDEALAGGAPYGRDEVVATARRIIVDVLAPRP
ncbi:TetR/AcrR family transcriptional regulator [Microbispora hainanensis]|uniref:TetR/AcrR family transcriptional regulator n=1 Tax=Microbispora hainanensis TaxID=568844 RepID=A0ABZ1T4M7_9ACTN|nr:TetR/AcrR family transcriptional regulator [Microbispora hainanensis]